MNSRPDWSTDLLPGQQGLHRGTLTRKTKSNEQKKLYGIANKMSIKITSIMAQHC